MPKSKPEQPLDRFETEMSMLFRAHPWHGIPLDTEHDGVLQCYIEMCKNSPVKLELDKRTGILVVDRPQDFSSLNPMPYGFFPRTYCGNRVGALCAKELGETNMLGDEDPLDLCVLTDCDLPNPGLELPVEPIGVLLMVDHGRADYKVLAVLRNDQSFGHIKHIRQVPPKLLKKVIHYFTTYKLPPGEQQSRSVYIHEPVFGPSIARKVINASKLDYEANYGTSHQRLLTMREMLSLALKLPK